MIKANEFYDAMRQHFEELTGCSVFEDSDVGIRFSAVAAALSGSLCDTNDILQTVSVQNAAGDILDMHAAEYGLERKPAEKATGTVVFSVGDNVFDSDIVIGKGTIIATDNDPAELFITDQAVTITAYSLSAIASVTAVNPKRLNIEEGELARICSPVSPLISVTNQSKITNGCDTEDDESLRHRILNIKNAFPCFVNNEYIKNLALQYQGVFDAAVIKQDDITLITVSVQNTDSFDLSAFNTYMFENLPIGINIATETCSFKPLSLVITVYRSTRSNYESEVTKAVSDFFAKQRIGKCLDNAALYKVIKELDFCENFDIGGLDTTFSLAPNQRYSLGDLQYFEV